ncbi:ABC transporter permease [Luteimonas terricola]|uniref:ABC transporter permease n=2 Tax=Luteimonas terricola TaxID=645597 RepID=A0ABQ2EH64_9GAMM|nr:ABC transporter permease [Luteimonas terricola]
MTAAAHKAWLQPSQTVIAGNNPWITVDAAVSNDLFYFNHVPLRTRNLVITAPDGTAVEAQNPATGKYRSVFDVELLQQGTYRIAVVNTGLNASWQEDGKPKRWRGTAETFATEVPKDAPELTVTQSVSRIETFVTNGSPTTENLQPSNEGLELVPVTHPNDLFAGEEARFRMLADGAPAAGVEFEITRGGTRYRNAQEEIMVTTDAKGEFTVTWPEAGMYWLEANLRDDKATLPQADARRLGYVATMEVLPQ